jgi:hypothetical protein
MQIKLKDLRSLIRESITEMHAGQVITPDDYQSVLGQTNPPPAHEPMVDPNKPSPKLADLKATVGKIHMKLAAARDPQLVEPNRLAQIQKKIAELAALVGAN